MVEKPKRAVEFTLKIGADNWEGVAHALRHYLWEVEAFGAIGNGCSGGSSWGDIRTVELRPEMTHERYFEALNAYLDAQRSEGGRTP